MSSHVLDRSLDSRGPELGEDDVAAGGCWPIVAPYFDLVQVLVHHKVLTEGVSHLSTQGVRVRRHQDGLRHVRSTLVFGDVVRIVVDRVLCVFVRIDDTSDKL